MTCASTSTPPSWLRSLMNSCCPSQYEERGPTGWTATAARDVLSPLQERVAAIIAGLEEASDFALAGGSALIAHGDIQRQTRDLDFFGLTADAVDQLLPAVESALQADGLMVHRIQTSHGFARLVVESDQDRTELDLGTDARLFPAEPGTPAPLLSAEELAVDKVLAERPTSSAPPPDV